MSSETYWALLGKYVRIEREATPEEIAAGEPEFIGGEGVVAEITTVQGSPTIMFDYGYAFCMDTFAVTGAWESETDRLTYVYDDRPHLRRYRIDRMNHRLQWLIDNWDKFADAPEIQPVLERLWKALTPGSTS